MTAVKIPRKRLIIVKGEKCLEKEEFINKFITESNGAFLHSDIDKVSKSYTINKKDLFSRQKGMIENCALHLNVIVNVYGYHKEKWERIANDYNMDFQIMNFSPENTTRNKKYQKEIDEVSDRIDEMELSLDKNLS